VAVEVAESSFESRGKSVSVDPQALQGGLLASDVQDLCSKLTGVQRMLVAVILLQLIGCCYGLEQSMSTLILPSIMVPINIAAFLFIFHIFRIISPKEEVEGVDLEEFEGAQKID
jgi:hypothetical protein